MKSKQSPDKEIHIRKKVAGGTTGAVLGAVVGGPVGALVGGVIGTVVGNAAETGKLAKLASPRSQPSGKPISKAKAVGKHSPPKAPKGKARTRSVRRGEKGKAKS
jgi:hypothetical protein